MVRTYLEMAKTFTKLASEEITHAAVGLRASNEADVKLALKDAVRKLPANARIRGVVISILRSL